MNIQYMIEELAELCGIIPEYYDIWGNLRRVTLGTKQAILRSMGYPVQDPDAIQGVIEYLKNRRFLQLIEPVRVFSVHNEEEDFHLYIPLDEVEEESAIISWSIIDEEDHTCINKKRISEFRDVGIHEIKGRMIKEVIVPYGAELKEGYYDIEVEVTSARGMLNGKARLIVAPDRCYLPPSLEGKGKTWGLSVNLYALRSERNQGVGDLTDLATMVEWVGRDLGGDFVAINPLHSTSNQMIFGISPYSPTSRLFSNLIYIDIRQVEDVKLSKRTIAIIESPEHKEELKRLKEVDLIDYEGVFRFKLRILEAAFQFFYEGHYIRQTPRAQRFREYILIEGKLLEDYATFLTLYEYFKASGLYHWKDWPEEYRSPDSHEIRMFRERHMKEVLFHKYIQWLAHAQIENVANKASESGMSIGLYRDLAVGSLSSGSDAWSNQRIFATGVDVGAPPDDFSLKGQNWEFPPLIPSWMREEGYEFFIQLIRKNLRYGGALRIDHALGLFRLFWIPAGMSPEEGAYVRYPYEDLLRIIALESMRNKAVIIAEDLGTIDEEVRDALNRFGMLSFRLFYFERDCSTYEFLPPEEYPEMAIVSTTTHDLPTLSGFWAGRDIEVKKRLNRYPDNEAYQRDLTNREHDRWRVLQAIREDSLLPPEIFTDPQAVPVITERLSLLIYRYLGKTGSKLLIVNLDDILGIIDQQNLPGTIDEYPNWRQKIPYDLESIMKRDIFEALKSIRNV